MHFTCTHTCTQHTFDLDVSCQRKKSINNRESVKGSFIALLFVFIYFLASGHCLSLLQSFRFYIYKAFPLGRQLKWPWNQSDQTHQWGIKCCRLMFTAVTGKCLSNWNINGAGNENRKIYFFLMFLKQKQAKKIISNCLWQYCLKDTRWFVRFIVIDFSNLFWLGIYSHFEWINWNVKRPQGDKVQNVLLKEAVLLFRW